MTEWKEVSEAEMRDFIANYPRKLRFDACFIAEPPRGVFNEFINDRAVLVAQYYEDYLDDNKRHYFIRAE